MTLKTASNLVELWYSRIRYHQEAWNVNLPELQGLFFPRPVVSQIAEGIVDPSLWSIMEKLPFNATFIGLKRMVKEGQEWCMVRCTCSPAVLREAGMVDLAPGLAMPMPKGVVVPVTVSVSYASTKELVDSLPGHMNYFTLWNFLNWQVLEWERTRVERAEEATRLADEVRSDMSFQNQCVRCPRVFATL